MNDETDRNGTNDNKDKNGKKDKKLGKLERVPLRVAWASESGDFTPWLALEENLKLLGETIGMDLELESQEKGVGPFRADILCKDTGTDNWVVIENQLERTDHSHLGQLLTYAAGLEAYNVIWIAEKFTDEHRAAMDWLNEHTDEKISLFGLEVELWRIGDSPAAPKFNIISKPNDWSRTVKESAGSGEMSEHRQKQLEFWTAYKDYMEKKDSPIRCSRPAAASWMRHSIECSYSHLAAVVSLWDLVTGLKSPEIRAELYLHGPPAKDRFAELFKQKDQIEKDVGFALEWQNLDDRSACRICVRQKSDMANQDLWPRQFEWLRTKLEALHRVFTPIMKSIRAQEREGEA
jgi:hypothetical protein